MGDLESFSDAVKSIFDSRGGPQPVSEDSVSSDKSISNVDLVCFPSDLYLKSQHVSNYANDLAICDDLTERDIKLTAQIKSLI